MGANSEPHTSADAYTARTPAVSYRPMDWNSARVRRNSSCACGNKVGRPTTRASVMPARTRQGVPEVSDVD